jgi:NADH-quinone oxidoreductase subunit C
LNEDDAVVLAERLPDVLVFMRDRLGYSYLSHITAVDYLTHGLIEVIYHMYSLEGGPGQFVRVRVPRERAVIPSIAPIWPGANLQEREAWDLYGVEFPGHPYHKRIYMWDEFEGHPMRKDFEKIGDSYFHFKWKGEDEDE